MMEDEETAPLRRLAPLLALPHVKEIHEAVSSVVEKKLSQYDGSAMARLAEEAASEEVAAIRMNGSLSALCWVLPFCSGGDGMKRYQRANFLMAAAFLPSHLLPQPLEPPAE